MASVASLLKLEREKQNISLSQVSADTRISLRHLESLEEGRYSDLPGGMYNRAFLRAYAERLSLDSKEILRRYAEEMLLPQAEKLLKSKVQIPPKNKRTLKLNPVIIWGFMLLFSVTGLFFSRQWISSIFSPYFSLAETTNERLNLPAQETISSESKTSVQIASTPTEPLTQSGSEASTPLSPNQVTVIAGSGELKPGLPDSFPSLSLEITATQECWISIEPDGNLAVRKLLEPGEVQSLNAAERFLIRVGNAGGVTLKINGKPAKPLGKAGEVIEVLINKNNLPDLLDQTAG
jgi:cytoskeleton protein RodZ